MMNEQAGESGGESHNNRSAGETSGGTERQNGSGLSTTGSRSRLLDKPVQPPRRGTVLKSILCSRCFLTYAVVTCRVNPRFFPCVVAVSCMPGTALGSDPMDSVSKGLCSLKTKRTVGAVSVAGAIGAGAGIWFWKKVRAKALVTHEVQNNENRLF
ncbi:hypothetical protein POM88_037293 [Heracleum sosnowskyi]|uniref:Uncharacterized protein n=1 Tax=Heracleum sosnowskyi TaxID=360622 RepID=A0AAD8HQV5_9APIA|nr:hypothetical protein POM88_037293 [Heracleum sosnowskyi]